MFPGDCGPDVEPYLDVLRQTEKSGSPLFQVRYQNKIYGVASRNMVEIFGLREKMHVALLTMGLGHELQ